MDWQIFAAALGFAGARAALDEYRIWKSKRVEIPLDWNPRSQAYEPDLKLKRLERVGRYLAWAAYGILCIVGYNAVANNWFN